MTILSKDVYLRLNNDILKDKNPETVKIILEYKKHNNIDLMIRNCMILLNEQDYNKMINKFA
jgi:hypothetical protein